TQQLRPECPVHEGHLAVDELGAEDLARPFQLARDLVDLAALRMPPPAAVHLPEYFAHQGPKAPGVGERKHAFLAQDLQRLLGVLDRQSLAPLAPCQRIVPTKRRLRGGPSRCTSGSPAREAEAA